MRWHALLINRYLYLRLPIRTFGYYRKNSINIDCHPNPVHTEHINNFQEKAMKKELGLVVPVYNESGAIKEVIQSWETVLSGLNINFDIHIYNDGSKDNTLKFSLRKLKTMIISLSMIRKIQGTALQSFLDITKM